MKSSRRVLPGGVGVVKEEVDEHKIDPAKTKKERSFEIYRDPSQLSTVGQPINQGFIHKLSGLLGSCFGQRPDRIQPIGGPNNRMKISSDRRGSKLRRSAFSGAFPRRVYTEGWDSKFPCAVIITIHSNGSFDKLFRAIPQQSPDPNYCIAVFEMDYETITDFLCYLAMDGGALQNLITKTCIQQVMEEISYVEPSSVLFNFECCNFCPRPEFREMRTEIMEFVSVLMDRGYMAMFSDFSLKSLIADWDTTLLGPNPFHHIGACEDHIELAFDVEKLQDCGSAQLQNVALMNASEGVCKAKIKCMANTIMYTLVEESELRAKRASDYYDLQVLSIATGCGKRRTLDPKHNKMRMLHLEPSLPSQSRTQPFNNTKGCPDDKSVAVVTPFAGGNDSVATDATTPICSVSNSTTPASSPTHATSIVPAANGNKATKMSGYAGHVILNYKSGGRLLTSAAHWIDLNHIDAKNKTGLLHAVEKMYGSEYANEVKCELKSASADKEMEAMIMQRSAKQIIQSAAPCGYSLRRGSINGGVPPARRPSMLSAMLRPGVGTPLPTRSSMVSISHLIPPNVIASIASSAMTTGTLDEEDDYHTQHVDG